MCILLTLSSEVWVIDLYVCMYPRILFVIFEFFLLFLANLETYRCAPRVPEIEPLGCWFQPPAKIIMISKMNITEFTNLSVMRFKINTCLLNIIMNSLMYIVIIDKIHKYLNFLKKISKCMFLYQKSISFFKSMV